MAEPSKAPTTINIDSRMQEVVVGEIDLTNYMLLGKPDAHRGELFLYAMALGWSKGLKPKIDKPGSGGFARTESLGPRLSTIIDAVHYSVVGFDAPDELRDHKEAYKIAEEYANGGFHLLEGELMNNLDADTTANDLIAEMNDLWNKWFA